MSFGFKIQAFLFYVSYGGLKMKRKETGQLLRSMCTVATAVNGMYECCSRSFGYDFSHCSLFISYTCMHTIFMFAPCINSIENTFIIPTDAHYYKSVEMLKQFKSYNTCPDMFRFMQEPSSGSIPVLG
jgi:hypothetical protein